jgi:hypothetical protein
VRSRAHHPSRHCSNITGDADPGTRHAPGDRRAAPDLPALRKSLQLAGADTDRRGAPRSQCRAAASCRAAGVTGDRRRTRAALPVIRRSRSSPSLRRRMALASREPNKHGDRTDGQPGERPPVISPSHATARLGDARSPRSSCSPACSAAASGDGRGPSAPGGA